MSVCADRTVTAAGRCEADVAAKISLTGDRRLQADRYYPAGVTDTRGKRQNIPNESERVSESERDRMSVGREEGMDRRWRKRERESQGS